MPDGCIRFHRAHFLEVLLRHLPEGVAHFGKRLTSYKEASQGVFLNFADGTSTSCDLLVGCDGIKSTIRKQMYEQEVIKGKPYLEEFVEPTWSGTMIYRALVPAERLANICKGRRHRVMDDATIVRIASQIVICTNSYAQR